MGAIIIMSNPVRFAKVPYLLMLMLAILTIGFPLIAVLLMKWLDLIESFEMKGSKERFIPMIAVATFLLWAYFMFKPGTNTITSSDTLLSNMILGSIAALFIAFPFYSVQKISFHTMGMGGLMGMLINIIPHTSYNLLWLLLLSMIISGLVGSARLYLGAHTNREVFAGYLIGFFGQFFAYNMFQKIADFF
jgi:membrane-associated phospholipid phosphatase